LARVHRRLIDRVISVFWSVRRYRCETFSCQWEGNLHQKRRKQQNGGNLRDMQ
jgi:hypothetical protein